MFHSESHTPRRRQFISGAGACAVGWLCGEQLLQSQTLRSMTLGFSTYGMPKMGTIPALQMLGAIGYDSVEIVVRDGWDADSAKLSKSRISSLKSELEGQNLRLTSLMEHVFPSSGKNQETAIRRMKLATQVANELRPDDPPVVQTVLGSGSFEAMKTELVDRLGKWAEIGETNQVTICIKPHRGGVVSEPKQAVWLLEQLRFPTRLRLVYDYSHYAFRGIGIEESLKVAGASIAHVAVKDATQAAGKVAFKLPGETGDIDFIRILRGLKEQNYTGDINCEVSGMVSGKAGYNPESAANFCYRKMSEFFGRAAVSRPAG